MLVTEFRTRTRVVEKEVEREEKYTAFKRVPKERKVVEDCWYLEDEVRQQEVEDKRCMVVNLPVDSKKNMLRPIKEEYCIECGCHVCKCSKTYLDPFVKEEESSQPTVVFPSVTKLVDYVRKTPKKHTIEKATETVYTLQPVTLTRKVTVCVPEIVKDTIEVKVWKNMEYTHWVCDECSASE